MGAVNGGRGMPTEQTLRGQKPSVGDGKWRGFKVQKAGDKRDPPTASGRPRCDWPAGHTE